MLVIYTVTFNPSLDYIISVNDFELGKTNRTAKEQMLVGGKGINVSTVLTNFGIENTALIKEFFQYILYCKGIRI